MNFATSWSVCCCSWLVRHKFSSTNHKQYSFFRWPQWGDNLLFSCLDLDSALNFLPVVRGNEEEDEEFGSNYLSLVSLACRPEAELLLLIILLCFMWIWILIFVLFIFLFCGFTNVIFVIRHIVHRVCLSTTSCLNSSLMAPYTWVINSHDFGQSSGDDTTPDAASRASLMSQPLFSPTANLLVTYP